MVKLQERLYVSLSSKRELLNSASRFLLKTIN